MHTHLMTCGSGRTKIVSDQLMAAEKRRKHRLGNLSFSVSELQCKYGEQWVVVTEALRSCGVSIHTEFGLDNILDTEERFDSYLEGVNYRIDRGSTPFAVTSSVGPPISPAPLSSELGHASSTPPSSIGLTSLLSPRAERAERRRSTTSETLAMARSVSSERPSRSPLPLRADRRRAPSSPPTCSGLASLRSPRAERAERRHTTACISPRPVSRTASGSIPSKSMPPLAKASDALKSSTITTSSFAEGGSESPHAENGQQSSVLSSPTSRPEKANRKFLSVKGGSRSTGNMTISIPNATSELSMQDLTSLSSDNGTNVSSETFVSVPSSLEDNAPPSVSLMVDSHVLSPVEGRKMAKEIRNPSAPNAKLVYNYPTEENEFRSSLHDIIDSMDWVKVEFTSNWLIGRYGKGKKTSLAIKTAYIQLYEELVDRIQKDHGMCLISYLCNTPGMPEDKDKNVAFVQQLVAVFHIARQFGCILDESLFPCGLETPLRVQTSPDGDSDIKKDSLLLSPCSVVLRDIGSPELSPPVYQARSRSIKRKKIFIESDDSDGEDAKSPKVKSKSMVSPCDVVLEDIGSPEVREPALQPHSRSIKRKAVIDSDDGEAKGIRTPKVKGRQTSELSLGNSDFDSPPLNALTGPQLVSYNLKKAGLHCSVTVKRRLRTEHPFLVTLEDAMKAAEYGDDFINNLCDDMVRIMNFYARDPYKFELTDLTDMGTLHRLSTVLQESGARAETRIKYMQALQYFIKTIRKSKYRHSHAHLMTDLELVCDEVELLKKRLSKCKKQEKTSKMADMALTKDDSAEIVQRFNEVIETKLRPVVRKVFEKYQEAPGKAVSPTDLLLANVFFITQFIKFGHRPVVFKKFPCTRYSQAKKSDPITSPELAHLGPFRYLLTTDHKTGKDDVAFVPFPVKEEWVWLETYVRHIRPAPSAEKYKQLLFLNSNGKCIKNVCGDLKSVMAKLDMRGTLSPRDIRHAIATLAFDSLEGKQREDVSTALCHKPETGRKHYVDSVTRSATRGLGLISKFLNGKSESYAPSSEETAVREETVSLKQYKTVSPTKSVRDNEKEVSDGSSVRPLAPRSETAARHQFIKECFSVTATRELPTKSEFIEAKVSNVKAFPELRDTPFKKFNETCRNLRNKMWAEAVVADIGRQRFKDVKEGLRKELEKREWFNEKTLKIAVSMYEKKVETGGRTSQAVSSSIATTSSTSVRSGKLSLIDVAVAKDVRMQEWHLAKVSGNEKGKGLFARQDVKKGTVVCDYHGTLLSYAEGQSKYLANKSAANGYMYCFQHGPVKYYIDANDEHCKCHSKKVLKGRLINHSSTSPNLKPVVEELDGRPVILFQAIRDIAPFEEFLFNYQCKNDQQSDQEDWM